MFGDTKILFTTIEPSSKDTKLLFTTIQPSSKDPQGLFDEASKIQHLEPKPNGKSNVDVGGPQKLMKGAKNFSIPSHSSTLFPPLNLSPSLVYPFTSPPFRNLESFKSVILSQWDIIKGLTYVNKKDE